MNDYNTKRKHSSAQIIGEVIFAQIIGEKSKYNYLPLVVSNDIYIPSCTFAYSVLPLGESCIKILQVF